jgi:hypothetical protein
MSEIVSCQMCGDEIDYPRSEWATTCCDCMADGCPSSPEKALRGQGCDTCDCVDPRLRFPDPTP